MIYLYAEKVRMITGITHKVVRIHGYMVNSSETILLASRDEDMVWALMFILVLLKDPENKIIWEWNGFLLYYPKIARKFETASKESLMEKICNSLSLYKIILSDKNQWEPVWEYITVKNPDYSVKMALKLGSEP